MYLQSGLRVVHKVFYANVVFIPRDIFILRADVTC